MQSVKLFQDGALGSRGAWLLEPYTDDNTTTGIPRWEPEQLAALVNEWTDCGFQVNTHAIGDAANRLVLDIYEDVLAERPGQDLRLRIEHAQILAQEDIPRFEELGVIASVQPTHATSDKEMAPVRLGEGSERLEGAYAYRSLASSGARLALGSDFPGGCGWFS